MRKRIWIFCLIGMIALIQSCDSNRIYEEYKKIPSYNWDMNHVLRFEVNVVDTVSAHNLYVNVRNTGAYSYSNIWLFMRQISPLGDAFDDKLECKLATETGEWYGSGFGDIFDLKIPYKQNVVFKKSGVYIFEIQHGMRDRELKDVVNVGLRIEKADQ